MRRQNPVALVLHSGPVTDDLAAPRHQAPPALGLGIGQPDLGQPDLGQPNLGQKAGRMQRGQDTGIDLVGLDMRVRNRLHLQRIGHDDAGCVGAEHTHHRHRVAGRLRPRPTRSRDIATSAAFPPPERDVAAAACNLMRLPMLLALPP